MTFIRKEMENLFYYKLEEAEQLRQTYLSWVGREAHTGKGKKQTLRDIVITQLSPQEALNDTSIYTVEFVFDNENTLNTYEFLFHNSLVSTFQPPQNKRNSAA